MNTVIDQHTDNVSIVKMFALTFAFVCLHELLALGFYSNVIPCPLSDTDYTLSSPTACIIIVRERRKKKKRQVSNRGWVIVTKAPAAIYRSGTLTFFLASPFFYQRASWGWQETEDFFFLYSHITVCA